MIDSDLIATTILWAAAVLNVFLCVFTVARLRRYLEQSYEQGKKHGWEMGVMEGHHVTMFPCTDTCDKAKAFLTEWRPDWLKHRQLPTWWELSLTWKPTKQTPN